MTAELNAAPPIPRNYKVIVEGKVDASWSDWLGGIQLVARKEADGLQVTVLSGLLSDQAALRGLLNRLWDLNLVVRSVRQVDPGIISNHE